MTLPSIAAAYLIFQMCIVWLIYLRTKNPTVVDVSWSIGILVSGLIYLSNAPFTNRTLLIEGLLLLWSLRLAGYLYWSRVRKGIIDKRYVSLASQWKMAPALGYLLNFQLQALLIFILTLLFLVSTNTYFISTLDYIAAFIVICSIIGESVADIQLQQFKKSNPKQVCNIGLWNYSRHPNYFFDWLMWCGFALFAVPQPYGCIGFLAPALMYFIFNYVTGPMTENGSITSRGQAYLDYQQKTPMFFPRFK